MTTEDEFQALLDANPDDHQTRLVFADWLQERGDPRAEGYRALGVLRKWPLKEEDSKVAYPYWWHTSDSPHGGHNELPSDWVGLIRPTKAGGLGFWPLLRAGPNKKYTRRYTEDAAALAFSCLSAERRVELLAVPPEPAPKAKAKPKGKKS